MSGVAQDVPPAQPDRGIAGVLHKRRVVPPFATTDNVAQSGGKRTFHMTPIADGAGGYLHHMASSRHEQPGPSLKETRFHKGFHRRTVPQPPSEMELVTAPVPQQTEAQKQRREYLANRQNANGLNPVTGGAPIVGRDHDQAFAKFKTTGLRTATTISKMRPPEGEPEELVQCKLRRQQARRFNTKREGLFYTQKDWSLGDQLSCCDGYAVSEDISNNGTKQRYKWYGTERHLMNKDP
mmetsp:Transcript_5384/g.9734  ORF Transcript_5384/g.9734 Transcript_5384/m.9734 type:complete len:238 (-) Transcript_5384:102-815(-)